MKAQASVTITPQIMAEAFWEMSSLEQVKFFEKLHDVISKDTNPSHVTYGNGELQWYYMCNDLRENQKAFDMATSMMAFVFLHSTRFAEGW